jgi:hypothetical protein
MWWNRGTPLTRAFFPPRSPIRSFISRQHDSAYLLVMSMGIVYILCKTPLAVSIATAVGVAGCTGFIRNPPVFRRLPGLLDSWKRKGDLVNFSHWAEVKSSHGSRLHRGRIWISSDPVVIERGIMQPPRTDEGVHGAPHPGSCCQGPGGSFTAGKNGQGVTVPVSEVYVPCP